MKNVYVLAFDCSTPVATVALNGTRREVPHGQQAAMLVPTIDALLAEAGIGYAALSYLVSTIGPGSFTGLRIALAALHGIALATKLPVKTITATQAVAWALPDGRAVVVLNAGKGEVFMQAFSVADGIPTAEGPITLHPQSAIHDVTLPCYSNLWPVGHTHYVAGPDAAVLARVAPQLAETPLHEAMPYYIRPADAKIPEKPHWLRT